MDPRFARLVPDPMALRRLADGCAWAEGPVWLPEADALLWSDIPNNRVLRWSSAGGTVTTEYQPSDFANGHTLDHDGTVLACEHGTRRVARYGRDGARTTVVDRYRGRRLNSPNDLVVASDGAIWFTDPPYGIISDREGYRAESELGACYVFRFEPATGDLEIVAGDLIDPNGLAFSPDESILYVSDTSQGRVPNGHHHMLAFDVVDGRRLANPARVQGDRPGRLRRIPRRLGGQRLDVRRGRRASPGARRDGAGSDPYAQARGQRGVRRAGRPDPLHRGDRHALVDRRRRARRGHALGSRAT